MKGSIPTPNITLKRILCKEFVMYSINEFRTSKLHHVTEEPCKNLYLRDAKTGKKRKVHTVLTYKMVNGRVGCINRDRNAVLNMLKITQHTLKYGKRPIKYTRSKADKNHYYDSDDSND